MKLMIVELTKPWVEPTIGYRLKHRSGNSR
jgi:hypothetical protein